jgi:AcrR family transcriptional regulator
MLVEQLPELAKPAARRRAETRREILEAAWQLCRERGLTGLSLRELAARVGIRAPSLYSYFASKDAIYDAMFAEGQREFAQAMDFLPETGVSREDFRVGNRAFFAFCTSDPLRYQLLFQRTIPGFVPTQESYALAVANLNRLANALRSLGVEDRRYVDLWTAMMTGLTDQQMTNDPGGSRWADLLDEAVDLFCDHLGIDPTTEPPTPTETDRMNR